MSWISCNTSLGILLCKISCINHKQQEEEEVVQVVGCNLRAFVDNLLAFVGHKQHPCNWVEGALVRNQEMEYNLEALEQEELVHRKVAMEHNP